MKIHIDKSRQILWKKGRIFIYMGFPGGTEVKASAFNVGDWGLIPGLGRSPGEGNGSPLQHSCLENPMDRGAWRAIVCTVTEAGVSLCGDHRAPPVNTSLPWTGLENISGT